jgi:hypothetical protein
MAVTVDSSRLVLEANGSRFLLPLGVSVVGRWNRYCDIILGHRSVSRIHCLLIVDNQQICIRDMGSANGVRVNGQRVITSPVTLKDEFAIASCKCRLIRETSSRSSVGGGETEPLAILSSNTSDIPGEKVVVHPSAAMEEDRFATVEDISVRESPPEWEEVSRRKTAGGSVSAGTAEPRHGKRKKSPELLEASPMPLTRSRFKSDEFDDVAADGWSVATLLRQKSILFALLGILTAGMTWVLTNF